MKNYLSRNERDNWLLAVTSNMFLNNIINLWGKNLTTDEKRKLKTSITMTNNALMSIADRMPKHEKDKLVKHSKDFEVKILSAEGAKAMEKRCYEEFGHVKLTEDEQKLLISEVITHKCADCNTLCNECTAYELFLNSLVPSLNEEDNCPYAYNPDKETEDEFYIEVQKVYKKHEENKKLSKRKQKKLQNRFDDPGTDYEYNFVPKGVK